MFSVQEKQKLAKIVEDAIRELNHPEMDNDNILFVLSVQGKEPWSYANIHPNSVAPQGPANPWNEVARDVLK